MADKYRLAYEVIKEKIISGQLPPMADISEKCLQAELGTSRTPIHEALARLREEGFVVTYPRKGTLVTDVTTETVRSVYEMRELNEPYLTQCACHGNRLWLEDIFRRFSHVPTEMSLQEADRYLTLLDTELHSTIASFHENPFLRNSMRTVYEHDRRIRGRTVVNTQQVRISQEEHILLVEAMLEGDPDRVFRLASEHIVHSRKLTFRTLHMVP